MQANKVHPNVTIITVVFNAVNDIEKTILSIISQTYSDYEYIVIDGGSTDGTVDVINKYSNYIACLISESDNGIYDAMNKGIALSKGKWLSFMNAGDLFFNNNVLEDVFNTGISNKIGLIYGDVVMNYQNGGKVLKRLNNISSEMVPYSLCHQSTFIDGDFMRETLYDTNFKICADANSFKQVLETEKNSIYVPIAIAEYEATMGLSAKHLFIINNEFMRIKGIPKYSFLYFKATIKTYIKVLPQILLPEKVYNSFIAKYVKLRNKLQM